MTLTFQHKGACHVSFSTQPGERGRRKMRIGPVGRWVMQRTNREARGRGGRLMGMNVLVLHTVGYRSGQRRASPVSWFADGDQAWLIVASARRPARSPDWYHNLAAHPDQVSICVRSNSTATPALTPGSGSSASSRTMPCTRPRPVACRP